MLVFELKTDDRITQFSTVENANHTIQFIFNPSIHLGVEGYTAFLFET